MKKFFLSPFFAPTVSMILWVIFFSTVFIFFAHTIPEISGAGGFIEYATNAAYLAMFAVFLFHARDFRERRLDYAAFLFLGVAAFLREAGIQHWIPSKDSTAFKLRFFTKPENPLCEKIFAALLLAIVAAVIIYVAVKYSVYLIKTFFKMDTVTWSVATLCVFLVGSKILDRVDYNYRKYTGEMLPYETLYNLEVLEETAEFLLPVIVIIILRQYRAKKRAGS